MWNPNKRRSHHLLLIQEALWRIKLVFLIYDRPCFTCMHYFPLLVPSASKRIIIISIITFIIHLIFYCPSMAWNFDLLLSASFPFMEVFHEGSESSTKNLESTCSHTILVFAVFIGILNMNVVQLIGHMSSQIRCCVFDSAIRQFPLNSNIPLVLRFTIHFFSWAQWRSQANYMPSISMF